MNAGADKVVRLKDLRVIVVDDNIHMRRLVKNLLRAMEITQIRESTEGSEALEELTRLPADLVITDWAMLPLDGVEFLKLLRRSTDIPNPEVPVIMLTSHTDFDHVLEARDAGMTEFLAKPVSAENLYKKVISALTNHREFVKSKRFVGPDRRRHSAEHDGVDRRKEPAS